MTLDLQHSVIAFQFSSKSRTSCHWEQGCSGLGCLELKIRCALSAWQKLYLYWVLSISSYKNDAEAKKPADLLRSAYQKEQLYDESRFLRKIALHTRQEKLKYYLNYTLFLQLNHHSSYINHLRVNVQMFLRLFKLNKHFNFFLYASHP